MIIRTLSVVLLLILASCNSNKTEIVSSNNNPDSILKLENKEIEIGIKLHGGAFVDVKFKDQNVNPLSWKLPKEQMPKNNQNGATFEGHFLCLGRWGSPTTGEKNAGVPHNGQASNTYWSVQESMPHYLNMCNHAPMDGMEVSRFVFIDSVAPVFYVKEEIKNTTTIGRLNNIVQHITLGAPFLDTNTITNTNATLGFNQGLSLPNPHKYEYKWPLGFADSTKRVINLEVNNNNENYCSTHIFDDEFGWITSVNAKKGLLIGYIWKTAEYPWVNVWQYVNEGTPVAKGIEFGTTGIGNSYQSLLKNDTRFHGRNSFEYLDATETVSKSYIGFLLKVPETFKGVKSIIYLDNSISITDLEGVTYNINLSETFVNKVF